MLKEYRRRTNNGLCRRKQSAAGFSLVELMVVLSIMLLITAIALPRFLDAQMKAYEASAVSFLKTLQSNQESYRLAHGFYADNFNDLGMVALGPAGPEQFFAPEPAPQSANLLELFGPFTVQAAQGTQQPPQQNPPQQPGNQGGVSGKANRNTRRSGGALGGIGGGTSGGGSGGGSSGAGAGGAGAGTGPGGRRSRRGSGGAGAGSTPAGGGTGSGTPAGSGTPQSGGGSGGGLSPTPPPPVTTNVVVKHNYVFTLTRPTLTTWKCTVAPVRNRGNARYLFLDQTGVMRTRMGNIADGTSQQM